VRKRFTASVYIRHPLTNGASVLLAFHKRFDLWVPVGGELEEDETPSEGAIREVREETGLEIPSADHLRYMGYEEHDAGGRGIHMNFSFLFDTPGVALKPCAEHYKLEWFTLSTLPDGIPSNVYLYLQQIYGGLYG